jgi:hypothetical protein
VHPDEKGIVRTVSINIRKPNSKEKPTEIFKNTLLKEKVGVQRLIVIQPANDPDKLEVPHAQPDKLEVPHAQPVQLEVPHAQPVQLEVPHAQPVQPNVPAVPHAQPVYPLSAHGVCVDHLGPGTSVPSGTLAHF